MVPRSRVLSAPVWEFEVSSAYISTTFTTIYDHEYFVPMLSLWNYGSLNYRNLVLTDLQSFQWQYICIRLMQEQFDLSSLSTMSLFLLATCETPTIVLYLTLLASIARQNVDILNDKDI